MSNRQTIANAFDALAHNREYDNFQEVAFHLARNQYPKLRLTRKLHDRGADAIDEINNTVLAVGWNGGWGKLKDDYKSIKEKRPEYKKVVFATSQTVSEEKIEKWKNESKQCGFELISVIHKDWIIGELERPENIWIAHRYLDLPIGNFADLKTYVPKIFTAAKRICLSWEQQYPLNNAPWIDLRINNSPEDGATPEFRISDLKKIIRVGDVIWLTGQPGIGKTQTLIDLAKSLLTSNQGNEDSSIVPLLVSLRGWAIQEDGLINYITRSAALSQQGIETPTLAHGIECGRVLLLLNGWNEIPIQRQERLKGEFKDLLGELGGATIVVSSRFIPEETWPRHTKHWKPQELTNNEIEEALGKAQVPHPGLVTQAVIDNWQLLPLARVPLFLWEIATEAKNGEGIPSTRFQLIRRLVYRACSEHRDSIRIEGDFEIAPRIMGWLAKSLTDEGKTEESITHIRPIIKQALDALQEEGVIGGDPSPSSTLNTLSNCHLLQVDAEESKVRFSHQLVQEYFAAEELARRVAQNQLIVPDSLLRNSIWSVALQMCIECLASKETTRSLAVSVVTKLVDEDLESACRAVGENPALWEQLLRPLRSAMQSRVESSDMNAQWIGARCAAATGQNFFVDTVYRGLEGYPEGSRYTYTNLPSDLVFRALGSAFPQRLLNEVDPDFRLRAFRNLCSSPSNRGSSLAKNLALSDRSSEIRMEAHNLLFCLGETELWRHFLREVKRQGGWDARLLNIAKQCKRCQIDGWRKAQHRAIKSTTDWKERMKLFRSWHNIDRKGASPYAKTEYEWCCSQTTEPNDLLQGGRTIREYRLGSLRTAATVDADWASVRAIEEFQVSGFRQYFLLPLELISDSAKAELVAAKVEEILEKEAGIARDIEGLAKVDSATTARWILGKIRTDEFVDLHEDIRESICDALSYVERHAQLQAAGELNVSTMDESTIDRLINTLFRSNHRD